MTFRFHAEFSPTQEILCIIFLEKYLNPQAPGTRLQLKLPKSIVNKYSKYLRINSKSILLNSKV